MRFILILLGMTSILSAQDYVDTIVKRNPFDPARGQMELVEEVVEPIVQNIGMPVLDGTIIIGEMKVALFTYTAEGRPKSTRVKVNESVQGYVVTEVTRNAVQLSGGGDRPILVTMYADKNKSRGGTKAPAGGNATARERSAKMNTEPEIITTRDTNEKNAEESKKQRFKRRDPPPTRKTDPETAKKSSMDNKI